MVDRVVGGKSLPPEVLEQIVAKTDGVPLFVEELTKTVKVCFGIAATIGGTAMCWAHRERQLSPIRDVRGNRRQVFSDLRVMPLRGSKKPHSWTWSFAGTMIGTNRSGIDHVRRGLAAEPRSR